MFHKTLFIKILNCESLLAKHENIGPLFKCGNCNFLERFHVPLVSQDSPFALVLVELGPDGLRHFYSRLIFMPCAVADGTAYMQQYKDTQGD